ncbi:unnamed protein product [Heterobilharzia americana]|nr:unnamed protein product [Heterobilharzia americana]CAH8663679.1 unnamed protein product [Heterobilharzia americana]
MANDEEDSLAKKNRNAVIQSYLRYTITNSFNLSNEKSHLEQFRSKCSSTLHNLRICVTSNCMNGKMNHSEHYFMIGDSGIVDSCDGTNVKKILSSI